MVVHLSWILPPYMKGNTQLPHPVLLDDGVVVGNTVAVAFGAAVDGDGEGVDPCESKGAHVYQSSTVF